MADQTLASFLVNLRYAVDQNSARRFSDTIENSFKQVNSLRLAMVGMALAAEEAIRRTTNNFAQLYYMNRATGVAAEGIMRLRAEFVGAGMDAKEADSALASMAKALRDPAVVARLQAIVGPVRDAQDAIEKLAVAYRKAVEAGGGVESEGPAYALRQQIEAWTDFEAVRNLAANPERAKASADAMDRVVKALEPLLKGGLKEATARAADMDQALWRLGQTFQVTFAAIITDPAIAKSVDDIATGLAAWLLDKETVKSIREALDAFAKWIGKKQNIDDLTTSLKAFGDSLLAIVGAMKWLIENEEAASRWLNRQAGIKQEGEPGYKEQQAARDRGFWDVKPFQDLLPDLKGFSDRTARFLNRLLGNPEEQGWTRPHYQHGGIVPANLHAGEMVLPQHISAGLQSFFTGGGLADDFNRWWAGDSSFRPIVDLAADVYRKIAEAFETPAKEEEDGGGPPAVSPGHAGVGGGGRMPGRVPGGGREAVPLPRSVYEAISQAEGTFKGGQINYDEVLGKGKYGLPDKPITQMTLAEAFKFGRQILHRHGSSSALGAFQIVGNTMRDAMAALHMNWNERFSPENQRKMADWIWANQGSNAWEGFKTHPSLRALATRMAQQPGGGPASTDRSTNNYNISATDPHGVARAVTDMRDRHSARHIRHFRPRVA